MNILNLIKNKISICLYNNKPTIILTTESNNIKWGEILNSETGEYFEDFYTTKTIRYITAFNIKKITLKMPFDFNSIKISEF